MLSHNLIDREGRSLKISGVWLERQRLTSIHPAINPFKDFFLSQKDVEIQVAVIVSVHRVLYSMLQHGTRVLGFSVQRPNCRQHNFYNI